MAISSPVISFFLEADFSFEKRNTQAINAIISIKDRLNDFINEMNVFIETVHGVNEFEEFDKKLKNLPRKARMRFLKSIVK